MAGEIKVMRAENYDRDKMKQWPIWVFPKVDGCRAYNPLGVLLTRSLKQHKNRYTTKYFSRSQYIGLDGELAAQHECHPDLCRLTSSAVGTIEGEPYTLWHLFDFVTVESVKLPYEQRYAMLCARVRELTEQGYGERLRVLKYEVANNLEEYDAIHEKFMLMGYEGSCYYVPTATHKEGKSSPRHGGCLRRKDFVDFEAIVEQVIEGETNLNVAQVNELGRQFRSSHQENKVPNGMVGTIVARSLADVFDLYDKKKIVVAKDQVFNSSPGHMTEPEKIAFFRNPELIVGKISKFKMFPKGVKDAPRFTQWVSLRSAEDL
jgi:DNA ligase-1